ncbi:MFS transporter [Acidianus sp. RZ1]|uniref:MFS transporter n=1 Tax=Acidianus sp. RZ1 TaxID=1540082 RepID=UPI0014916C80|nr:MFS transporter [Acidianus sp. RZ1]NON63470.1 MFS transporter [Acidianus sp. RZ1]
MTETKKYEGSVIDRLERLPFSNFHLKFLLMLASGEWAETLMLLGNGALLALVSTFYGLKGALAAYALPAPFFAGEFVGSWLFGYLADKRGRRSVFLYNQIVFGLGMLLAGLMPIWQLIALFVFIGGIGVGGEFPLVDSYSSEMFKGKQRGSRLALIYTIAVTAGPFIVYITSLTAHIGPLSNGIGYYSFRIPLWIMGIAGIMVWAVRLRLTESPRWLETHGKFEEADMITTQIEEKVKREKGISELPPVVSKSDPFEKPTRFKDLFAPDIRTKTIMMLIFQILQGGIFYGFATFAPSLIVDKYPFNNPLGYSAIVFLGFFVGSVFNVFIIDKVERKWGIILSAVLSGITGTLFAVANSLLAVVTLGFLTAFLLWNFSNFFHQYQAEIFPTRVRTTAAGFVYAWSRISTSFLLIIIGAFFLPHGPLAVFEFAWLLIAIIFVDLAVLGPKATGKKLEEISK